MVDIFKDMEKPFLPMLIANWIFGIGIIEYPIRKPHRILSFIYTSLILAMYGYLAYVAYPNINITWIDKLRPVSQNIIFFVNIIVTVTVIISGWFQTKGLHKCFLKAAQSNYLMQKIGIPKNHSKILRQEIVKFIAFFMFIILVIIVNSVITFTHYEAKEGQIIAIFIQSYPLIIVFIADFSFMNILGYANYKFDKLNEVLKNLLTGTPDTPLHRKLAKLNIEDKTYLPIQNTQNKVKDYTYIVKTAKLAHLRLVKLCREANVTYGFHILLSIVVAFGVITTNVFNVYLSFAASSSNRALIKGLARSINWFLYFGVKITATSWLCTTVCTTSVKTGDLISELYDEPLVTEPAKAEIRYFNVELIQNKLVFDAYGFVYVDLTLVRVMFGGIITYAIILIQFRDITFEASVENGASDHTSIGIQSFLQLSN